MLHARRDYQDRIQDSANLIPGEEPVFLIRAQDVTAPWIVRMWISEARRHGAKKNILEAAEAQIERMVEWQRKYGMRIPDMPDMPV